MGQSGLPALDGQTPANAALGRCVAGPHSLPSSLDHDQAARASWPGDPAEPKTVVWDSLWIDLGGEG
jgi:hypothetical protein